jgi:hypothetical protein
LTSFGRPSRGTGGSLCGKTPSTATTTTRTATTTTTTARPEKSSMFLRLLLNWVFPSASGGHHRQTANPRFGAEGGSSGCRTDTPGVGPKLSAYSTWIQTTKDSLP